MILEKMRRLKIFFCTVCIRNCVEFSLHYPIFFRTKELHLIYIQGKGGLAFLWPPILTKLTSDMYFGHAGLKFLPYPGWEFISFSWWTDKSISSIRSLAEMSNRLPLASIYFCVPVKHKISLKHLEVKVIHTTVLIFIWHQNRE